MPKQNPQIIIEHQLTVSDEKGCRDYSYLDWSDYKIGKNCRAEIRLYTRSSSLPPYSATLVQIRQDESFDYQLVAISDSGYPPLLVNGNPIQTHLLKHGDEITFAPGVSATYYCYPKVVFPPDDMD